MQVAETRADWALGGVPTWLWDGETLPVPIEEIAESHFGLEIREVDDFSSAPGCPPADEGRELSGLLLADQGEIWLNADEARALPARRRFTIAHELGHWCLHRCDSEATFCRHRHIDLPAGEGDADAVEDAGDELEANAFAASLLMPSRLVEHHYHASGRDLSRLCELFAAPAAAMDRRVRTVVRPLPRPA